MKSTHGMMGINSVVFKELTSQKNCQHDLSKFKTHTLAFIEPSLRLPNSMRQYTAYHRSSAYKTSLP
jgi:hypothetical protein